METQQRDFAKTTHHSSKDKVLKSGRIAGRTLWFCSFLFGLDFIDPIGFQRPGLPHSILVGGLEHLLFFHVLGIITPTEVGIPPTSLGCHMLSLLVKLLAGTFARLEIPSILTRSDILERRVAQALLVEILHWKYVVWKKGGWFLLANFSWKLLGEFFEMFDWTKLPCLTIGYTPLYPYFGMMSKSLILDDASISGKKHVAPCHVGCDRTANAG